MAIIDTLTPSQAAQQLRQVCSSFTYAGALALCEYLDELSESTGEPIEFDPIAWCCEYSEWGTLRAWWSDWVGYDKDVAERINALGLDEESSTEERDEAIREYIADRGTLIEFDTGIIVSSF
jgi:hypothetical protein